MAFDAETNAFIDQYARPVAELIRNLKVKSEEMQAQWDGGISAKFAGEDATVAGDQNAANHPVTGADVTNTVARAEQILDGTGFTAAGGLQGVNMMDAPLKLVVREVL